MEEKFALGVDIGGTKTAVALVNDRGDLSYRKEYPSDIETRESLFQTLLNTIHEVLEASPLTINDIKGIGVGVPGKVDAKAGVAVMQNNIPWANFPLVERLRKEFGKPSLIIIDNDVKMAAIAEYIESSLEPEELFTYITLSTGVAATTIINNEIIRGSGFSGEIGFIPVHTKEGYSSVENLASGPAIQRYAQNLLENNRLSTKNIFELYLNENQVARKAINRSVHAMALVVYSMITILDPKTIVFGGSVVYRNPFYLELLKEELDKYLVHEQKHILDSISVSKLGGDNGIIGAGLSVFLP